MREVAAHQERVRACAGDLGVARFMSTNTGMADTVVGTPFYMSPELFEEKPYSDKTDIWALGCVLYEMCTFKRPFEASNQAALMLKASPPWPSPSSPPPTHTHTHTHHRRRRRRRPRRPRRPLLARARAGADEKLSRCSAATWALPDPARQI